jgi:hypothetical protein
MNKTEFKKKAKALVKSHFDVFKNVNIIENECGRSTIDNELFINYVVIINKCNVYFCRVSDDSKFNENTLYYKETRIIKTETRMGLYNSNTLEKIY